MNIEDIDLEEGQTIRDLYQWINDSLARAEFKKEGRITRKDWKLSEVEWQAIKDQIIFSRQRT